MLCSLPPDAAKRKRNIGLRLPRGQRARSGAHPTRFRAETGDAKAAVAATGLKQDKVYRLGYPPIAVIVRMKPLIRAMYPYLAEPDYYC